VFSATNSVVLTAPRVFYAMAKDNLFFKTLADVHPRFHTPVAAIIALCAWSAILTFAGKFTELASGVVFIGWIFYGLGAAAIFPLRAKLGGNTLPYRVPGYPFTPIVFLLAAAAVVGNAGSQSVSPCIGRDCADGDWFAGILFLAMVECARHA
jgi:APA family basic amino acid/polyamine antiporter